MAQLVAHLLCKQGVRGSSPLGSTHHGEQHEHGRSHAARRGRARAQPASAPPSTMKITWPSRIFVIIATGYTSDHPTFGASSLESSRA